MSQIRFADTGRFPNDTIDGETVLIDSSKGHLFLFTGIGPQLWQRLATGVSVDTLVEEISTRYGPTAAAPTRSFFEALDQAQMLRNDPPPSATPAQPSSLVWPENFESPAMEHYDQIADIISMDPIHEVDPAKGWPHRPGDKV